MKSLRSIKNLLGKNVRLVRMKKKAVRLGRHISKLTRWKKIRLTALFVCVRFAAKCSFLHRLFILGMHVPPSSMEKGDLPRIVVFGLGPDERKKLASTEEGQRCAVAYTSTPAIAQCLFLAVSKPILALVPSGKGNQLPPSTWEFLRAENVPMLAVGEGESFSKVIGKLDADRTAKFFPALLYTDGSSSDTVLILHHSLKFMDDAARAANIGNAVLLPSKKENEHCLRALLREVSVTRCLVPEQNTVPENLLSYLKEVGIKVDSLSQKVIRQLLLLPLTQKPPFPGAPKAVLLNMEDASILADKLIAYHVFSLKSGNFHTAINLLRGYTFVWVGSNVPKLVREAANHLSLPVLHFCESILSSYGWRKSYAAPLWLTQIKGRRNADTAGDMQVTFFVQKHGDRLDSAQELEKAGNFLQELLSLQKTLHDASVEASGKKVKRYGEAVIIAIWQSCRDGLSLEEFLKAVAAKEQRGRILVFALSSYSVITSPSLPAQLQKRCVLMKHLADLDDYFDAASCVHLHGAAQGFESILREKRTVAHVPAWYTGWGLTEDMFEQERPRVLTKEQLVLASILSFSYTAPYSFEPITPQTALAFWYTRQRPDLGRFHEAVQKAFKRDSRFGVLDMSVSFHNEPAIDTGMAERLRCSVYGHVMADMLSSSVQMPKLPEFFSLFSPHQAIYVFQSLILQAYYQLNYEQLDYILHHSSTWFSRVRGLTDKEIVDYYKIYHDSVIRNWFHDSRPPALRLPVNAVQKSKALLSYARILVMCFAYDELKTLASREAANCAPKWYADLLFSLYNNRRSEIKDTSIEKHIEMRLLYFDLYRKARIAKGLEDFSAPFVNFMHESLKEDRSRMLRLASEMPTSSRENMGREEQDMVLLIVDMLRENLEHELADQLAQALLPAYIVKRLKDKERVVAQKDSLHGQRAKMWRVNALKMNLQSHLKRNGNTVRFDSKLARGNDISIYRHYLDSAAIVNKAPTVRNPKGIIFFGNYGTFFSAILPVVLYALRKRGYAVWPMFSNHIPLNVPFFHPLAKFAYALPRTSGPLQLEWTLDYENKRIEAVGVNFYDCFFEAVTILVRRYEFDWESANIQRQFRRLLKKTDSVVAWVHTLCGTLEGMKNPPKVAVMSQFSYNLPESALRVYLASKGRGLVHFVYYKNVANYDLVHSRSDISTRVSGLDMTLWPDCRLSFLPARSRFNPWYEQRKDSPEFRAALEQIRQNLLSGVTEVHSDMLDYLREQKAQGKRIICCIGRLLFDQAEHKPGGPAHGDISDWLRHSVEIAASDPGIIVLIRPHPHESNPTAAVRARQTMRDVLPKELPPNVLYVDPLEMTVQSLIGIMDLAVLWLGTAAWELSALGIPCAVMSHSGYDQVPFQALFPSSREEYARLLTTESIPQPDEETRLRGAACLHYVKTANQTRPYPYAFVRGSNSFRTVPWYRKDLIKKFMAEGDENIDFVVNQIIEGIPLV